MTPVVSIVIPIFNEEASISSVLADIEASCQDINYEILLVNDGSTDGTSSVLQTLVNPPKIKLFNLSRNFGQTAAISIGVENSKGEFIIPIDADGQNDPRDILKLIEKCNEGWDVVSGWRSERKDHFFSRILPSMIANKLISFVTGVPLHDYGCSLKIYRKSILEKVQFYGEIHRFLPAWCAWMGGMVTEVTVNHRARSTGKSKYGMSRFFKVIIDLITLSFFQSFLFKPNYLFSGTGLFFLFISFLSFLMALIDKLGPDQFDYLRIPLLLLSVFLGLVAIFLISIGLLAELLARIFFQIRGQSPYPTTQTKK
ncbi:MAG: glycosyltransferase family 2 protein [Elusimicrobiota bacterium]